MGTLFSLLPVPRVAVLIFIGLVAAERLIELVISRGHERALCAQGAVETGAGHYPFIVAVHAGWLAALTAWVLVLPPLLNPVLAVVYLALQPARVWVIASLGPYWTTRIISLPGASLVRRGPYRWLRHPNYTVVVLEIAILPLAFGAWPLAVLFSLLNAMVLRVRIAAENQTLAARR
jgi:methyltransferase